MQLRIAAIITAFLATTAVASPVEIDSSCTATSYDQIAATKTCTAITIQGPFTVPANSKIDLTGLITGTTITITGKITFAKGTLDESNNLVTIGGSDITIDGSNGSFDGSGPDYWDGGGAFGGINKPKFIRLQSLSGTIKGLTVVGSPVQTFIIYRCTGLTLSGITIDNR
ncbi:pectin lyase fold/virulence factor, partial [Jimgerdemannia flammicorona]